MIEFHCSECHEYGRLKEHEDCEGTITYEGYPHDVDPHDPRAFLLWWLQPLKDESEFTAHTRWAVANLMENAVSAAASLPAEQREMSFTAAYTGQPIPHAPTTSGCS